MTLISYRDRATGQALQAIARDLGLTTTVIHLTRYGYEVPQKVADAFGDMGGVHLSSLYQTSAGATCNTGNSCVGPPGPPGPPGFGIAIKGTISGVDTPLPSSPEIGDLWVIGDPVPADAPPNSSDCGGGGTPPFPAEAGDGLLFSETGWITICPIAGPPGEDGSGIVIDDVPPTDPDSLWADTTETGAGSAQTVKVFTYTDDTVSRPDATVVFWIPDPYDLPNPLAAQPGDLVLRSTPNVLSSATGLTHIEHYTVSEYDAIATPDPNTVYLIVADP